MPVEVHLTSPNKHYQLAHHQKMSKVAGGNTSQHVNESVSPHSILRKTNEHDIDFTIQKITTGAGPRSNRAQLLRQLALKKKFDANPFLQKTQRLSIDQAMEYGEDPTVNIVNMQYQTLNGSIYPNGALPPQVRMRNRQGQYQSIDAPVRTKRGSSTANTARRPPVKQAEYRLRMIEQISKYREEKIKMEFLKLEEDLRMEDER